MKLTDVHDWGQILADLATAEATVTDQRREIDGLLTRIARLEGRIAGLETVRESHLRTIAGLNGTAPHRPPAESPPPR